MNNKNLLSNVLKAGIFVGRLDISTALIQLYIKAQKKPLSYLSLLQGVFGKEDFTAGNEMTAFGLYPKLTNYVSNHMVTDMGY